ncbi:hypothetical protein SISSUDRAFT_1123645 [Sistotremastrum suecicum HHB10207 ss-3]|uniref:Uncharacterized protein n=1 Tax=Sistotremastrum suecicum HHB10207 ss-3 TaxID=1314776 RepID=A0A165X8M8_9AGAM|nr:hypothetical protein SISSUDRAFT_1123645 [Sistotremastrum suecicum HHB10207 ss-3]
MALVAWRGPAKLYWVIGITVEEAPLQIACMALDHAFPAMIALDMISRRRESGTLRISGPSRSSIADLPGEIISIIRGHIFAPQLHEVQTIYEFKPGSKPLPPVWTFEEVEGPDGLKARRPHESVKRVLGRFGCVGVVDRLDRLPCLPAYTITSSPLHLHEKFTDLPIVDKPTRQRFLKMLELLGIEPTHPSRTVPTAISVFVQQ